jgi:hypothetical protein
MQLPVLNNKLTNSRMSTMLTCPRKHQIAYELGIRVERESHLLRIGGAVHVGLDTLAMGQSQEAAMAAAMASYDTLPDWCVTDEHVHEWYVEREKVGQLVGHYAWNWSFDYEVIATEQSFDIAVPWLDGWRLAGKIDKVIRLPNGTLAIMEHKTTSDDLGPGSRYWRKLLANVQIRVYYYAALSLGYDVQTVIYDVIKKPTIKPLSVPDVDDDGVKIVLDANGNRVQNQNGSWRQTGDTKLGYTLQSRKQTPAEYGARLAADIQADPAAYFYRHEIPLLERDMSELRDQVNGVAALIELCRERGHFPRNEAACVGRFGDCEYLDLCCTGWRLDDAPPPGFVVVENVHPEL